MTANYDEKCQLLIVGDTTVGKTSILTRFTENKFNQNYLATVGLDFFTKDVDFTNPKRRVRIKIWDSAGQERFRSLTQSFFRNANGIIIVYDVSNIESFENLKYWIQSINTQLGNNDIHTIVIGNKIDLARDVKKEDAENFCKEKGYKYFEVSAQKGEGIEEAINYLVELVIKSNSKNNKNNNTIKLKMEKSNKNNSNKTKKDKKKDDCC
jgi:small GTP-binding protein